MLKKTYYYFKTLRKMLSLFPFGYNLIIKENNADSIYYLFPLGKYRGP